MNDQTIGAVAKVTGIKVPTIRYYEEIGLLPSPSRTESNRRTYRDTDVQRLTFIRHSRDLGFNIDAIRTLLQLQDDPHQSCAAADEIARARLADVEARITSLAALKLELNRMIDGCSHGRVESCRVIEVLADHGQCEAAHPPGART